MAVKNDYMALKLGKAEKKASRAEKLADNDALACAVSGNPPSLPEQASDLALPIKRLKRATGIIRRNKGIRPKRKKSPTLSKLKKLLWHEISLLVRSWSRVCVACDLRPTECAAHIVPSNEGAATRFFLPNLYPCCVICNGLENWNRANWVYIHKKRFGDEFVDALFAFSETTFQLKKDWVLDQTARIRKLRGAVPM